MRSVLDRWFQGFAFSASLILALASEEAGLMSMVTVRRWSLVELTTICSAEVLVLCQGSKKEGAANGNVETRPKRWS